MLRSASNDMGWGQGNFQNASGKSFFFKEASQKCRKKILDPLLSMSLGLRKKFHSRWGLVYDKCSNFP